AVHDGRGIPRRNRRLAQAIPYGLRQIAVRRERLALAHLTRGLVERDEVGERAADVDGHAEASMARCAQLGPPCRPWLNGWRRSSSHALESAPSSDSSRLRRRVSSRTAESCHGGVAGIDRSHAARWSDQSY